MASYFRQGTFGKPLQLTEDIKVWARLRVCEAFVGWIPQMPHAGVYWVQDWVYF
jgi:hypothetical protein